MKTISLSIPAPVGIRTKGLNVFLTVLHSWIELETLSETNVPWERNDRSHSTFSKKILYLVIWQSNCCLLLLFKAVVPGVATIHLDNWMWLDAISNRAEEH